MFNKQYYVYIVTNTYNTVFYTGITNNLHRRIYQHQHKSIPGFTEKYNLHKLVYFEIFSMALDAITREKQIKKYRREKKLILIKKINPQFKDLFDEVRE